MWHNDIYLQKATGDSFSPSFQYNLIEKWLLITEPPSLTLYAAYLNLIDFNYKYRI